MPSRVDAVRGYKALRNLRKDFDMLRKEFGGIPEKGPNFRRFALRVIKLVDTATIQGGIKPFPMIIEPKTKKVKPLNEVRNKGKVKTV